MREDAKMLQSHTCAHEHACGSNQTRLVSDAKCVESLASVKQTADGDACSAEDDQERITWPSRGLRCPSVSWDNGGHSREEGQQKKDRK